MLERADASLKTIESEIHDILDAIIESNAKAVEAYETKEKTHYEQARSLLLTLESDADAIDDAIVMNLGNPALSESERNLLVTHLKIVYELVRIGSSTRKYSKRIETFCTESEIICPYEPLIVPLHQSALRALMLIRDCFKNMAFCDVEDNYRKVMVEESKNDDLYGIVEQEILGGIQNATERSVDFVKVLATIRKLERICDRAGNIANLMIFAKTGGKLSTYSM